MKKVIVCAALVALAALPMVAQTDVISRGEDGWTTPAGGQTQVNLQSFPIQRVLGSAPVNPDVSLKGKPLDTAALGSIDTLIVRPNDIAISGGSGSGDLQIVALSLESVGDIVLQDGRRYRLRVCLSGSPSSTGSISLSRSNSDGGTFASTLPVLPKLIFTPVGGGSAVVIDCGTGACGEMDMSSANTGWVNTGGSGNFNPVAKGVTPIRSGIDVDADCDGAKDDYRTIGKGTGKTLHAGFAASAAQGFPAVAVGERHEDLSWHEGMAPLDCASSTTSDTASVSTAAATADPTPATPALCPVKAVPHEPVEQ